LELPIESLAAPDGSPVRAPGVYRFLECGRDGHAPSDKQLRFHLGEV